MKVIDRSPQEAEGNAFTRLQNRIRKIMEYGLSWESDLQAQEVIITQLGKALNNKYFLLRNVQLEGLDIPIPMILVGPPGLYVMYTSALKGVYRAKSDSWQEMNGRTRKFEPARPNLITRTLLMTRAVETYLSHRGRTLLDIQSVLLFSNPGTHVDSIRPALRIVLMDGLERFVANLTQNRTFLTGEDVQTIVDSLAQPTSAERALMERADQPKQAERPGVPAPVSHLQASASRNMNTLTRKFNLSTRQWLLLGVMAFVEVIILGFFIVFVLLSV